MKKIIMFFIGIVVLANPALSNATIFQDNFETDGLNSWPSNGWTGDGNANSDPSDNKIVADPTNPDNKVFKLFGALGASWAALAYTPVSFPSEFSLEFKVYNGSENLTGAHPDRAYIGMRNGTYWYAGTNPVRYLISFMGNGNILASDGSVLGTYETEQWYDVKVLYNRENSDLNLKYWIDGIDRGAVNITISDLPTELSLDHFEFASQEGSAYLDNVVITPEPATLLLLGLGGLMLRKKG